MMRFFRLPSGWVGADKSPGVGLLTESGDYLLFTEAIEILLEE